MKEIVWGLSTALLLALPVAGFAEGERANTAGAETVNAETVSAETRGAKTAKAKTAETTQDLELRRKIAKVRAALKRERIREARSAKARTRSSQTGSRPAKRSADPEYLSMALQMAGALVVILVLAVFSIRGLKRLQQSSFKKRKDRSQSLELLDTCYLGKDQKIALVRVMGKEIVVGATPHSIQLIQSTPPLEDAAAGSVPQPEKSFAGTFRNEVNSQGELARSLNEYLSQFKRKKQGLHSAVER